MTLDSGFSRWRAQLGVRLGHAPSMVTLGAICESTGSLAGLEQANALYRRAAELGNPQAMCNLGINFLAAKGGETDNEQALVWLRRAGELRQPMACWTLGKLHLAGRVVEQDVAHGMSLMRQAADAGFAAAAVSLADIYRYGKFGLDKDSQQARWWAIRSRSLPQRLAIKLRLAQIRWPDQQ